ncbi:ectonucleoside triphosphate diphosphohydrolase 2-like [Pseudophryne corroboree]|uniref:ectonucleoside triphosphate diphosphohydrolase 2-like n=1 Tax=Pseudophryne corroboree TaxID=495146 RepID=UPI0030816B1D
MPVESLEDLRTATDAICSSTYTNLSNKSPPYLQKHLNGYCITSSFIYLIISNGYKFDNETFPDISYEKAGDTSIGWVLGYMLNLINMIPAEENSKATNFSSWTALIFVVLIILALIIFAVTFRSNKQQQTI